MKASTERSTDTVNIEIDLPHIDFYNGKWTDVVLFNTEREEYVGVDFLPESGERSNIKTFLRKHVTIVETNDERKEEEPLTFLAWLYSLAAFIVWVG